MILKAEIDYYVLDKTGEVDMRAFYNLNITDMPEDEYKAFIYDNAQELCEPYCEDGEDFLKLGDISFEYTNID